MLVSKAVVLVQAADREVDSEADLEGREGSAAVVAEGE